MSRMLTCPNGHQWEAPAGDGDTPVECPMCNERSAIPPPPRPPVQALERVRNAFVPAAHDTGNTSTIDAATVDSADSPTGAARPGLPGYEILGELGRGGMGVVYKARQVGLKRLVALKMILGGPQARARDLSRFRSEAEAIARMQHPHIVHVYEVGEHQSQPFFSLEFVDGGSLASKLAGVPQAAEGAADLVAMLARAVQAAHERGVIHRDLKPANVLLMADGTPKITDFGLAKQLDNDVGQTQSGAIMGTPSYMAPEQALGQLKQIGPATDVYALGAILYEMLTGQPPFREASVLETLHKVREVDPVPPRRLQPKVPRDLETICLKCLRKSPKDRYASALGLAHDLERFRAGDSILARPEGAVSWLWRRVRRHRAAVIAGVAAATVVAAVLTITHQAAVRRAQQIDVLRHELEAGFSAASLDEPYLQAMEGVIERFERLAPAESDVERQRLHQRFADAIRDAFSFHKRPVLRDPDIEMVQHALGLLAARAPDLERQVAGEFGARLRQPQMYELKAPFTDLDSYFDLQQIRLDGAALLPANGKQPRVLTKVACQGSIEEEVVFAHPDWEKVAQLGLVLNAGPGQEGYAFLVSAPSRAEDGDEMNARQLLGAAQSVGRLRLKILRNGILQREHHVPVPAGPLRLHVSRNAETLSIQVNDNPPVRFQDAFPASTAQAGRFALEWPAGVRLSSLRLRREARPAAPSPLEQGDALFTQGQLLKAMDFYRSQAAASSQADIRQEARCKEALCLLGLQRDTEASQLLEQVSETSGRTWPTWAMAQLWLLRLKQKRLDEATEIFSTLSSSYKAEELASFIPAELRTEIGRAYEANSEGINMLRYVGQPAQAQRLHRWVLVQTVLSDDQFQTNSLRLLLSRAERCAGANDEALDILKDLIKKPSMSTRALEEYLWLLRERGELQAALQEINQRLAARPRQQGASLLVERARVYAAQRAWQPCEQDLLASLGVNEPAPSYQDYSAAFLMLGFLKEERGDAQGARADWQQGLYPEWLRKHHPQRSAVYKPAELFQHSTSGGMLHGMILASLSGKLSDQEADTIVARLTEMVAGSALPAVAKDFIRIHPDALRAMWRSRRARDCARRIAFRDLSGADYVRFPALVFGYTFLARETGDEARDRDEDAILWKMFEDYLARLAAGQLSKQDTFKIVLAYNGHMSSFGWKGVAPRLPEPLRAPLAYFLGLRFRHRFQQPDHAAELFRAAVAAAQPGTPLHRLAKNELDD